MPRYNVTLEDDAGYVWEGEVDRDRIEINDYVVAKIAKKNKATYAWGIVIMYEEIKENHHGE